MCVACFNMTAPTLTALSNGDAMGLPVIAALTLCTLLFPAAADAQEKPKAAPGEWSYDKVESSQDQWGLLSPDYAKCEIGTQQSPISISFTDIKRLPPLQFNYERSIGRIVYRNYTMEIDVDGQNTLVEDGHEYQLKKIVLHSPSEHTVRSQYWLSELQFVHEDKEGKILIVSVFVRMGPPNNALQRLLTNAPKKPGKTIELEFAPFALLPKKRGYYAYTGSLTIPPCTEGVEWRILKGTIHMSQPQLELVTKLANRNARQKQPTYLRTVLESKE
jgi:carbonic anhydrase